MRAARLLPRAAAAVAVLALCGGGGAPPAAGAAAVAPPTVHVAVDVSTRVSSRPVSGLLHGVTATAPPVRWIDPLRPGLWRCWFPGEPSARMTRTGARIELVVSDLWGYPGLDWYGRRPPWEDLGAWRDFVTALARRHPGGEVVWDIWNEPDMRYSWTGTRAQFLETYRVAAQAIRATAGPRAVIAGPSVGRFRWDWMAGLVRWCSTARCEVNALTWHELGDRGDITRIVTHARKARSLRDSGSGVAAAVRRLEVNESVAREDALFPGEQAAYLAYMERAGIHASARACWQDPDGTDTCAAPTLDGLLDARTMRPRAVWWVMREYGRGVASRVASTSGDRAVVALAARRGGGGARVLLGYFDTHRTPLPAQVSLDLAFRGLGRARTATVALTRIPATGAAPVQPVTKRWSRPVSGGRLRLTVAGVALHDAVVVEVAPGGGK